MVAIGHLRPRKACFFPSIFLLSSVLFFYRVAFRQEAEQEDNPIPQHAPSPDLSRIDYFSGTAEPCNGLGPKLLAIVHSSPGHIVHREAIRQTWGSSRQSVPSIRTVFVVGHSKVDKIWQRVLREAEEYGDLVLVQVSDSYKNLTIKHLAGLGWALKNCPDVSFILKADDDAFIDMKKLSKILDLTLGPKASSRNVLACHVMPDGTSPRRSGKWKVTHEEYPYNEYPEYCSGLAYFGRPHTLSNIYDMATSGGVPYLWIDDVYVTGLATALSGVRRLDLGVWFARTEQEIIDWFSEKTPIRPCPWIVAEMSPRHWPVDAWALWNKTLRAWASGKD